MGVSQPGTNLLDVADRALERYPALSHGVLQIAAGQILKHQVMKDSSLQVAGRSVADTADDVDEEIRDLFRALGQ